MRLKWLWLTLAAFSFGLCIELAERWRTVAGLLGVLISFFGAIFSLDPKSPHIERGARRVADLHETVVAETFESLGAFDAAALVGVLHEYQFESRAGKRVESLELHAAIRLVASVTGHTPEQLQRLYQIHWSQLRDTTAPRLRDTLERHELVERLVPYPHQA